MNKAQLYRPAPKWHFAIALVCAAALHLSALAIAARHYEAPVAPSPGYTVVEVDPPDEPPASLPVDLPVPPAPPQVSLPDFVEAPPPPRHSTSAQASPIRSLGPPRMAPRGNPKAFATNAPRPEYPYEARSRHIMGSGVAAIEVDPATGIVLEARMEQSIGNPILDHATVSAFRRWRFKRGTVSKVKIPVTFTMSGASY